MNRTTCKLRPWVLVAACALLSAAELHARQPNEGASITGDVTDRDNTRVAGTVYDHQGQALASVNIWVINNDAPARRERTRTRKTGTYLARNLGDLLEEFNLEGINLRLLFEREGYRSVETTVGVARNGLGIVHPILWPAGVEPAAEGVYAMLTGKVTGANGKPVRDAKLTIGSPESAALTIEVEVAKDGTYEALLWEAPRVLRLEVTAPGAEPWSQEISMAEQERPDLVQLATYDISLGG
jgi:hypothetical protein